MYSPYSVVHFILFIMITIRKITYISFLTAILFVVKLAFGFIAGVEFVTSLLLLYAIFLPLNWTMIITVIFITLVGLFYGFGVWWIIYWFIWPTEVFLTWLFRKRIGKNNVIFAFWTLFWGFSIIFWYTIPNYLIGGRALVIASFISGWIVNMIEGISDFMFSILMFYPLKKLFAQYIPISKPIVSYKENKKLTIIKIKDNNENK